MTMRSPENSDGRTSSKAPRRVRAVSTAPSPTRSPHVPPSRHRSSRLVCGLLVGVFFLAAATTIVTHPNGLVVSVDPGYEPTAVPLLLVPALVGLALVSLVPLRLEHAAVEIVRPRRMNGEIAVLVLLAVLFPLVAPLLPLPEDYVLLKAFMFMLLPVAMLAIVSARGRGSSVRIHRPRLRWWLPLAPVAIYGWLAVQPPFAPPPPDRWPDLPVLLVAASATAITASFGEELFYRRFLQTRLEALWGRWAGILCTSLLFGLMHLGSHGEGPLWQNAAQVVALQGTSGVLYGWLWSRYRRLWACVLAHLLLNGLGVVMHLFGIGPW